MSAQCCEGSSIIVSPAESTAGFLRKKQGRWLERAIGGARRTGKAAGTDGEETKTSPDRVFRAFQLRIRGDILSEQSLVFEGRKYVGLHLSFELNYSQMRSKEIYMQLLKGVRR